MSQLSPGTNYSEEPLRIPQVVGAPTSVTAMLGVAERGPIGVPTRVTSWKEWVDIFGSYITSSNAPQCVQAFFNNVRGGQAQLVFVRVVHYSDITDNATGTATKATIVMPNATPATTLTANGKTEGTYAAALSVVISAATSGKAAEFNLSILKNGIVQQNGFFPNLTMGTYTSPNLPTDDRYAPNIVNKAGTGSQLVALVDALVEDTATARRPTNGTYVLAGGNDGLTSLADTDFTGDSAAGTGLYALDTVPDLALLGVPGRATSAVHNAMLTYCETYRESRMFAVLDPPAAQTASQMVTYVESTASLKNASEFGAIYWPEYKSLNPNKAIFGNANDTITIPPSGGVLGCYARRDASSPAGVHKQPANVVHGRTHGAIGLADESVKKRPVRDIIYPANINPIWGGDGSPIHIDGSANLKRDSNFPSVGGRRGAINVASSIVDAMPIFKHENITDDLLGQMNRTVKNFLRTRTRNGAFASKNPDEAFFVDTGRGLNPPSERVARRTNMRIGLATAKPNEFTNILLSQDTRLLEAELVESLQ